MSGNTDFFLSSEELSAHCPVPGVFTQPYHSVFAGWDDRSSVRAHPRRLVRAADVKEDTIFFPASFVPLLHHPQVASLSEDKRAQLITQHFYRFMQFTVALELEATNPVCHRLATNKSGFTLPGDMAVDAMRIATDECYHALFSQELCDQVAAVAKVAPRPYTPPFIRALEELKDGMTPWRRHLIETFYVIVAESLVSNFLNKTEPDARVPHAILEAVHDHFLDETVHASYFRQLYHGIWPLITQDDRDVVRRSIHHLLKVFLSPDVENMSKDLESVGVDEGVALKIIHDIFSPATMEAVHANAAATLRRNLKDLAFEG